MANTRPRYRILLIDDDEDDYAIVRRQLQTAKLQADRLASIGLLAAGLAHEINNPLAFVRANLEFLQQELPKDGDVAAALKDMAMGAERIGAIVGSLKSFSRA